MIIFIIIRIQIHVYDAINCSEQQARSFFSVINFKMTILGISELMSETKFMLK